MSYFLGIDLGTTYTAAAVHDGSARRAPEVVTLGERGPTIPSVLCLQPDGGYLAGDAAERQALTDPQRIARQFKRRLGDPTPLQVGDAGVPAEVLTSRLLRFVLDTVARSRQGQPPATVALTHPANWGPYKRDLLEKAAQLAGLPQAVLVTEPQAAAISYSSQERVDEGAVVAVYDLGGGTFDAAVLRKEADGGFSILGSPEGIERLGGIDVDAAVFAHVTGAVAEAYEGLDPDDPQALVAVARLRTECTQAKEALSLDTEVRVPVLLPSVQTEVRVTRAELEDMIRPTLAETVTALERALRSAAVTPDMVDHVLLVGGSSRIPLVSQLVSSGIGRPVAVDAHPKHAVALGAALVAARAAGALRAPNGHLPPPPSGASAAAAVAAAAGAGAAAGSDRGAAAGGSPLPPPPGGRPAAPAAPATPAAAPVTAAAGGSPLPPPPGASSQPAPPPASPPPSAPTAPPPPSSAPTAPPPPPRSPADRPAPPASPGRPPAPGTRPAGPSGYRGGAVPPAPGTSTELPPGYLTDEAKQQRRRRERRKKRVMALVAVVVLLGAALLTVALSRDDKQSLADVEVGECFSGDFNDIDPASCDEPHQFELVAIAEAADPDADFPGDEQARTEGGNTCALLLVDYYGAGADVAVADGLELVPVPPSEAQWDDGQTDTYCLVADASNDALEASVRGAGA